MEYRVQIIFPSAKPRDVTIKARTYQAAATKAFSTIPDPTGLGGIIVFGGETRPTQRVMGFQYLGGRLVPMKSQPTMAARRKTDPTMREHCTHLLTITHDGKVGQLFRKESFVTYYRQKERLHNQNLIFLLKDEPEFVDPTLEMIQAGQEQKEAPFHVLDIDENFSLSTGFFNRFENTQFPHVITIHNQDMDRMIEYIHENLHDKWSFFPDIETRIDHWGDNEPIHFRFESRADATMFRLGFAG